MNTAKHQPKNTTTITVALALVLLLTLSTMPLQNAVAQTTHNVDIVDFAFIPQNISISSGDTILWNNTGSVIHTLWFVFVANGSTYTLSDPIIPGATWSHTFSNPVELQYYSFHMLWITGFINVTTGAHDVAVTHVTTSKAGCPPMETVAENYTVRINATIENQGDFAETFNIRVKANTTIIGTFVVVGLNPAQIVWLTLVWNTSGFGCCKNYSISVEADIVPGETDTADNVMVYGVILVTLPGDVEADCDIDIYDIVRMASAYGKSKGDLGYDSNSDVDDNDTINIFDIVAAAGQYGKSC